MKMHSFKWILKSMTKRLDEKLALYLLES